MHSAPDTRLSLILRLQSPENEPAWHEFWELYQPVVYRVARGSGLQDADATDVAQEVMHRVAKAVDRWNPDKSKGSFRGWLRTITRNYLVQYLRGRSRQPAVQDDAWLDGLVAPPALSDDQASRMFELERQREVFIQVAARVREQFQPPTWQAFWGTAVESRPVADVARELNLSCGAVYVARSRVMARLREAVEQLERSE